MSVSEKTEKKTDKSKSKQILNIISVVITVMVVLFAVFVLISSLSMRNSGKPFYLFGYTFNVVVTDSMTPEIAVEDMVVAKKIDISEVNIGDNVIYIAKSGVLKGRPIIHKCIKKEIIDGEVILTTQGIKPGAPVDDPINADNFVGKQVGQSTFMGHVVVFFSNVYNCIYVVVILLIAYFAYRQIRRIIRLTKEKKQNPDGTEQEKTLPDEEKTAALDAERQRIREELLKEMQDKKE